MEALTLEMPSSLPIGAQNRSPNRYAGDSIAGRWLAAESSCEAAGYCTV